MRSFYTLAAIAALTTAAAAQSPLVTLNAANNGGTPGGAVYFDITVSTDITINELRLNCNGGTDPAVDIYLVPNATYLGNEAGGAGFWGPPAASGMIGTIEPTGTLSLCSIVLPVNAGQYAVAIANGAGHAYTNGTGANQQFMTTEITADFGSATNVALTGPVFNPRVWNGEIEYGLGASGTVARSTTSGQGCGGSPFGDGTAYEQFIGAGFDFLPGEGWTATWNGAGYDLTAGASAIVAPTGVNPLALGDDQTVPVSLGFTMPSMAGDLEEVFVCSNGYVALESTTVADFSESVQELLDQFSRVCPLWTDLNPSTGVGSIDAEGDGAGNFHVTWTGIEEFGTAGSSNTFQISFNANGTIEVKYDAISAPDSLIGLSTGNTATDPGASDFSAINQSIATGSFQADFEISAGARPVTGTTTDWSYVGQPTGANTVAHIGIPFVGGGMGLPLDAAGFPGCFAYVAPIVVQPTTSINIPNDPLLVGVVLSVQGISLGNYPSSNGVGTTGQLDLSIGDL